jgi:uncharacterized protein YrrD
MEFKDGTKVFSLEGKEVGSLQRVVIDPETNDVTHIVIQKGLLFVSDQVISVDVVASASEEKINLNCTMDELKEMPPLDVEQHLPIAEMLDEPDFIPLAGGLYPEPITQPNIKLQIKRTIPEELVALKEGARVVSRDDKHVGNIDRVFTDPETGKATHFIVSHGLLVKAKKSIPVQWVRSFDDDEVQLIMGVDQYKDLPENKD